MPAVPRPALLACLVLGLALAAAPVAAASDASLCRAAQTQHRAFLQTQLAFTEAFTGGNMDRAAQRLILLGADRDRYRSRIAAQRPSSERGRQLKSAIFRMLDRWRGALRAFDDAIARSETGAEGAPDRFMDGLRELASAAQGASRAFTRASCRQPRLPQ
jgi:hypothetical protein